RRETGDGRRETGDGRRETGDGRRETGDGRRETGGPGIPYMAKEFLLFHSQNARNFFVLNG
ncbi:MAG: hypothetical protein JL50_11130, partial [Peptococcaceae bacterium BICA1-7]